MGGRRPGRALPPALLAPLPRHQQLKGPGPGRVPSPAGGPGSPKARFRCWGPGGCQLRLAGPWASARPVPTPTRRCLRPQCPGTEPDGDTLLGRLLLQDLLAPWWGLQTCRVLGQGSRAEPALPAPPHPPAASEVRCSQAPPAWAGPRGGGPGRRWCLGGRCRSSFSLELLQSSSWELGACSQPLPLPPGPIPSPPPGFPPSLFYFVDTSAYVCLW